MATGAGAGLHDPPRLRDPGPRRHGAPRSWRGSSASRIVFALMVVGLGRLARPAGAKRTGRAELDLDRYIARESPLHRADARLKFLLAVAFIVAVSLLPTGSFAALAIAWAALAVAVRAGRAGAAAAHARSSWFALPFVLAALPLVFTRRASRSATIDLGPLTLTISGQGLREFATIALKSWVSVQAALLLSFTTPFPDLVDGLRRLRLPADHGRDHQLHVPLPGGPDRRGDPAEPGPGRRSAVGRRPGRRVGRLAGPGRGRHGRLALPPLLRAQRADLRGDAGARLRRRVPDARRPGADAAGVVGAFARRPRRARPVRRSPASSGCRTGESP